MDLKGVIFDLDGTLGDTLPVCFAAFREVFQTYLGRTYSDQELRAMFGPTEEGMIEQLVPERRQECVESYFDAYERAHQQCAEPFPGIKSALALLRQRGLRLAVVTGKGPRSAAISLRWMGLSNTFESVEAGSSNGNIKPQNMRKVISGWGLDPGQVASLGDAPSDVRSARQIGALPLAAAWAGTTDFDALHALGPHAIFRQVAEFIDWIEQRVPA